MPKPDGRWAIWSSLWHAIVHIDENIGTLTAPQIIDHRNRTLANYARVIPADAITFAADTPN
jgi:hypothetical protein